MSRPDASRLPIRVRLVAGFSATMVLVLLAAGAFVFWRVHFALDRQLDSDLTGTAARLAPLVGPSGALLPAATPSDRTEAYQVLDAAGTVLASSPALGPAPLLSPTDAATARNGPVLRDIGALLPIKQHPLRAYAVPLPAADAPAAVLVVAVRRDHRDEALLELLVQLGVAGAGALVLTGLVGYLLARSALRPVERYRAQAARIVEGTPGLRLDVPDGRDDEVTRLGRTLNAMLDALESAVERERDFVRDASHELRTPVTVLTTRVDFAAQRPRTVAEHEEVLREIRTDLDRLARLTDHLLRVDPGPRADDRADLARVARDEVARRTAGSPAGTWRLDTPAPVAVALAPVEVASLVGNLLDNALLHGAAPVHLRVDHEAGLARLRVEDAGPGMPADLLAAATQRFARAAESRSRPGFGLGLSLVAALVARAGGGLRLCHAGHHVRHGDLTDAPCEHGPGMCVTVLLPPAPDRPAAEPTRPAVGRVGSSGPGVSGGS